MQYRVALVKLQQQKQQVKWQTQRYFCKLNSFQITEFFSPIWVKFFYFVDQFQNKLVLLWDILFQSYQTSTK
jgi:hypothetical protein